MITDNHWRIFQLVDQEGNSYQRAAELMGVERECAKQLMSELRREQPELFPVETEKRNLGNQIPPSERRRRNMDVVSYDTRKDGAENVEDEIKQKF